MSLLRPIIRCAAVGALRDRTWAQERVYDSDLTPLATAVFGGPAKPYIVCYTDADDLNPVDGIAEVYSGANRTLSLAIEIGVASAVRNTNGDITIKFAATDSGMEWACDVCSAQAIAALVGDPQSKWGEIFKRLITNVRRIPSRRGGMSTQGVRFAARRLVFQVQPMWDFTPGVVPSPKHPVWDFINLARAEPLANQVDVATIVESLMTTQTAPDWRIAQAQLGITKEDVLALNIGPLPTVDEEAPYDPMDENEFVPPLLDITVFGRDESDPVETPPKPEP
jgi:hypothetical protein